MSRLIDADVFKKNMDYICDEGGWLEPVTKAVREFVKKHIDAQTTVHPEPHWIPCSKKPDKRDVYRVTVQCEHVDGYPDYETCYGEYDEHDGWFLVGEPVGRTKMVAWMPIDEVEPYQPEEERL